MQEKLFFSTFAIPNKREMYTIRKTTFDDIPCLMEMFREARAFMAANGNPQQWGDGYPDESIVRGDIERGVSYVIEDRSTGTAASPSADGSHPVGTFALIPGKDPTYAVIDDGAWQDDTLPYATIHRLASCTGSHGIADACIAWSQQQSSNLRADTYRDNTVVQHILQKHGFRYCGIIYVRNHSPRLAYQWLR